MIAKLGRICAVAVAPGLVVSAIAAACVSLSLVPNPDFERYGGPTPLNSRAV